MGREAVVIKEGKEMRDEGKREDQRQKRKAETYRE